MIVRIEAFNDGTDEFLGEFFVTKNGESTDSREIYFIPDGGMLRRFAAKEIVEIIEAMIYDYDKQVIK